MFRLSPSYVTGGQLNSAQYTIVGTITFKMALNRDLILKN